MMSRSRGLCRVVGGGMLAMACLTTPVRAADNIILFIGDGMGFAHLKAGRAHVYGTTAQPLSCEQIGFSARSITTLPGGGITDSASGGTALASGYQPTRNGLISMDESGRIKTNLVELARARGLRTGIITTDEIAGATPGAFGAHEPSRGNVTAIRDDYFWTDPVYRHGPSLPDVLLGGGYSDPTLRSRAGGRTYVQGALALGYAFADSADTLNTVTGAPLLGLFGTSWSPMTAMAYRGNSRQPTLSQMLSKALTLLRNDQGFFLMVESALIDKMSHSHDRNFVREVRELDAAVQLAMGFADENPDTLVLLTADHETGGLIVSDQTIPPGAVPSMTFTSGDHTAALVPVHANWPPSLDGLTLDNTEIFNLADDFIHRSVGGRPPVINGLKLLALSDTTAVIAWRSSEPSDAVALVDGLTAFQGSRHATNFTVTCNGLTPETTHTLSALSTDLAGFQSTESLAVTTLTSAIHARTMADPSVAPGVLSGIHPGTHSAGDGLAQILHEALPLSPGSEKGGVSGAPALVAEYTLHTPVPPAEVLALTLEGRLEWTGTNETTAGSAPGRAASDLPSGLVVEIRTLTPAGAAGWEPITLPFAAQPPSRYLDPNGDIRLRFSAASSTRRERRDKLTIDYLAGIVLVTPPAPH